MNAFPALRHDLHVLSAFKNVRGYCLYSITLIFETCLHRPPHRGNMFSTNPPEACTRHLTPSNIAQTSNKDLIRLSPDLLLITHQRSHRCHNRDRAKCQHPLHTSPPPHLPHFPFNPLHLSHSRLMKPTCMRYWLDCVCVISAQLTTSCTIKWTQSFIRTIWRVNCRSVQLTVGVKGHTQSQMEHLSVCGPVVCLRESGESFPDVPQLVRNDFCKGNPIQFLWVSKILLAII